MSSTFCVLIAGSATGSRKSPPLFELVFGHQRRGRTAHLVVSGAENLVAVAGLFRRLLIERNKRGVARAR